jgi:hypothetical protein
MSGSRLARRVGWAFALVAGCAPLGLHPPGTPNDPEIVEVVLTDTSVVPRPRLVARGKVGLELVNRGHLEQGFRVVGPGVDEQSDEFLGPDEHRRLWLKLAPGTYRLFCPDGNHAALGMSAELVVTDTVGWFRR